MTQNTDSSDHPAEKTTEGQTGSDYDADVNFGHWLREVRTACGLTLEEAALRSGITEQRMKSLEVGYAAKGIIRSEVQTLAALYKLNVADFLKRAAEADEADSADKS